MRKILAIVAIVLGIVVLAGGIAAISIGRSNATDVTNNLKAEKVSLAVFETNAAQDQVISNASQARTAIDTLIKHRQAIAPTYSDLLKGKHFDPTNPTQLTYAQAMNLQNSLTSAVLAYGLTTTLTFNGALLIVAGLAIAILGFAFWWYTSRRRTAKDAAAV
jgi:outer membrane murein-binding lipoprotein Lpp